MNFVPARTELFRPLVDSGPIALDRAALLRAAAGTLLGDDAPRLPQPPLLAFDTVWDLRLASDKGPGGAMGNIAVERFAWAFDAHFQNDPVVPGALIVDGLLQLVGLHAAFQGFRGLGRAVRIGATRFRAEVRPCHRTLVYEMTVTASSRHRQAVSASGRALVDGTVCVEADDLLVVVHAGREADAEPARLV